VRSELGRQIKLGTVKIRTECPPGDDSIGSSSLCR